MSFLYEQENLKLLASALNKQAQQTGPIGNPVQVAKKLVSRLSREINNTPEAPNVSSDAPSPVGLSTEHLQNIGNLLKFLDTNQIKIDGMRVAYDQPESEQLPTAEVDKLSPVTINVSRDAASRKWNTADYYVNLPLLIKYVSYLQEKSKQDDNKVLSVMVGKLIDQVNIVKPDSGLSRRPKSVPGQTSNELPDNTQLDSFGTKIFDSKSLNTDAGTNPLQAKDLKTREALNAWLLSAPEAQVVSYDAQGKKLPPVKFSDESADRCVIINSLFRRAKNLLQARATSPEDTKKYNFYISRIQELGQSFMGPDGQACIVGNYQPSANRGGDTTLVNYQDGTGKSSIDTIVDQRVSNIISTLPLSIREINLDKIFEFIGQVKTLSSGARSARLASYTADLTQRVLALKNLTRHQDAIFPTNIAPKEFADGLKDYRNYLPALDRLGEIVSLTRQMIEEFYSAYGSKLDDQQKTIVLGQIGRNRNDNSIYARNIEDIQSLKNKVHQVLRVK